MPVAFTFGKSSVLVADCTETLEDGHSLHRPPGCADQTGVALWPAASVLCSFLLSPQGQKLIQGRSVLELGSGIGLPGLLAAKSCAALTLSDNNDEVLGRLRESIELNDLAVQEPPTVVNLSWGADAGTALRRHDVLLGSDVIYSTHTVWRGIAV